MRCLEETLGEEAGFGTVWLRPEPYPWGKCDFLGGMNWAGWMGGGILSLGEGSSNVRHSSACPLGRALSRNSAVRPCRQKFVTWDSWCLVKSSAVGLQSWGAAAGIPESGVVALTTPLPDWRAGLCNLLRSVFKLFKLGRLDLLFRLTVSFWNSLWQKGTYSNPLYDRVK